MVFIRVTLRDHLPSQHGSRSEATAASAWSAAARTSAAAACARFGWHGGLVVQLGDRDYQQAFFALAGNDHRAFFATFDSSFKRIKAQTTAVAFFAMTPQAIGLEDRLDVFGVGDSGLVGWRRKFGEINFCGDFRGQQGRCSRQGTQEQEWIGSIHFLNMRNGLVKSARKRASGQPTPRSGGGEPRGRYRMLPGLFLPDANFIRIFLRENTSGAEWVKAGVKLAIQGWIRRITSTRSSAKDAQIEKKDAPDRSGALKGSRPS